MGKVRRGICRAGIWLVVLLALVLAVWYATGGVSNRMVQETVWEESAAILNKIDARANEIVSKLETMERRLGATDRKLDAIDGKLDRLLRLADPPPPDEIQRVD